MIETIHDRRRWMIRDIVAVNSIVGRETSYTIDDLIGVILKNLTKENKHMLVALFHSEIESNKKYLEKIDDKLTDRERACMKLGEIRALCELIEKIGSYDDCMEKYLNETVRALKEGDNIYYLCHDHVQKTSIKEIGRRDGKVKIEYRGILVKETDYKKTFFSCSMADYLKSRKMLNYCNTCYACEYFKKGKCAAGFLIDLERIRKNISKNRIATYFWGHPQELCTRDAVIIK